MTPPPCQPSANPRESRATLRSLLKFVRYRMVKRTPRDQREEEMSTKTCSIYSSSWNFPSIFHSISMNLYLTRDHLTFVKLFSSSNFLIHDSGGRDRVGSVGFVRNNWIAEALERSRSLEIGNRKRRVVDWFQQLVYLDRV